jgi:hypothetical protein
VVIHSEHTQTPTDNLSPNLCLCLTRTTASQAAPALVSLIKLRLLQGVVLCDARCDHCAWLEQLVQLRHGVCAGHQRLQETTNVTATIELMKQ